MDLDLKTAPVIDEFGNAEYDNTIGEYIMNSLEEYDEEDTQFFDIHDDASHDAVKGINPAPHIHEQMATANYVQMVTTLRTPSRITTSRLSTLR